MNSCLNFVDSTGKWVCRTRPFRNSILSIARLEGKRVVVTTNGAAGARLTTCVVSVSFTMLCIHDCLANSLTPEFHPRRSDCVADDKLQHSVETIAPALRLSKGAGFDVDATIYCTAGNSCPGAGSMVAHGIERGAIIHTFNKDGHISVVEISTHESDVLATDWLDPHLAVLGHRNGTVQLFVRACCRIRHVLTRPNQRLGHQNRRKLPTLETSELH